MNQEQPIIVGLDIGTTKIAAIAGRKNEYGKLEILGFGRANSNGVKHGQVLNIDETIKAIACALENCYASNPNLEISEVYVGIAGHHIKSLQTRGDIVRQTTEEEISQREIDQLVADQYKTYIPAGDQIIDVIPQEFTVDNFQNIPNPIGYGGVKVGANFHIITGDKNAIRNINRAVEKSGLSTKDLVLQPDSQVWLGSLFWTPTIEHPTQGKVPLQEWFDDKPIPEMTGENSTDPKLLGIP